MKSMDEYNYYDLLEVSHDAPRIAIQEAFLSSRSLFDDDSVVSYNFLSDQEREAMLIRFQEAYETLMNDQKRMEYDKKIFHRVGRWRSSVKEAPALMEDGPSENRRSGAEIQLREFRGEDGLLSLQLLREALAVTLEEIARVTRIRVPMIRALENRDFRKLPPAIYVKGYLKSYAETLGIEPKRLIRTYGPLSLNR